MSALILERAARLLPTKVSLPVRAWRLQLTPCRIAGPLSQRAIHTSQQNSEKPRNPDPRENPVNELKLPRATNVGQKRFADFDLAGKVFVVTGGAQGLGLTLAESLVEAGGKGSQIDHTT